MPDTRARAGYGPELVIVATDTTTSWAAPNNIRPGDLLLWTLSCRNRTADLPLGGSTFNELVYMDENANEYQGVWWKLIDSDDVGVTWTQTTYNQGGAGTVRDQAQAHAIFRMPHFLDPDYAGPKLCHKTKYSKTIPRVRANGPGLFIGNWMGASTGTWATAPTHSGIFPIVRDAGALGSGTNSVLCGQLFTGDSELGGFDPASGAETGNQYNTAKAILL